MLWGNDTLESALDVYLLWGWLLFECTVPSLWRVSGGISAWSLCWKSPDWPKQSSYGRYELPAWYCVLSLLPEGLGWSLRITSSKYLISPPVINSNTYNRGYVQTVPQPAQCRIHPHGTTVRREPQPASVAGPLVHRQTEWEEEKSRLVFVLFTFDRDVNSEQ